MSSEWQANWLLGHIDPFASSAIVGPDIVQLLQLQFERDVTADSLCDCRWPASVADAHLLRVGLVDDDFLMSRDSMFWFFIIIIIEGMNIVENLSMC